MKLLKKVNPDAALTAGVCALLVAAPAFAGTDATFDGVLTTITGYLEGSLGKVLAVGGLIGGLGMGFMRGFSMGNVGAPVAIGLGAGYGVPIVTSSVTATV